MENALKTFLVSFQTHRTEKLPLGEFSGDLTLLDSEALQGGIFRRREWRPLAPKKKFVTKIMDEKHNENMHVFCLRNNFWPFGPTPSPPEGTKFWCFRDFFSDLAYGLS